MAAVEWGYLLAPDCTSAGSRWWVALSEGWHIGSLLGGRQVIMRRALGPELLGRQTVGGPRRLGTKKFPSIFLSCLRVACSGAAPNPPRIPRILQLAGLLLARADPAALARASAVVLTPAQVAALCAHRYRDVRITEWAARCPRKWGAH